MASQWHCDVVVVDITTFAIVAAVELDDASHLKNIGYAGIFCWKRYFARPAFRCCGSGIQRNWSGV